MVAQEMFLLKSYSSSLAIVKLNACGISSATSIAKPNVGTVGSAADLAFDRRRDFAPGSRTVGGSLRYISGWPEWSHHNKRNRTAKIISQIARITPHESRVMDCRRVLSHLGYRTILPPQSG